MSPIKKIEAGQVKVTLDDSEISKTSFEQRRKSSNEGVKTDTKNNFKLLRDPTKKVQNFDNSDEEENELRKRIIGGIKFYDVNKLPKSSDLPLNK